MRMGWLWKRKEPEPEHGSLRVVRKQTAAGAVDFWIEAYSSVSDSSYRKGWASSNARLIMATNNYVHDTLESAVAVIDARRKRVQGAEIESSTVVWTEPSRPAPRDGG